MVLYCFLSRYDTPTSKKKVTIKDRINFHRGAKLFEQEVATGGSETAAADAEPGNDAHTAL